jgi:hypothetical protein
MYYVFKYKVLNNALILDGGKKSPSYRARRVKIVVDLATSHRMYRPCTPQPPPLPISIAKIRRKSHSPPGVSTCTARARTTATSHNPQRQPRRIVVSYHLLRSAGRLASHDPTQSPTRPCLSPPLVPTPSPAGGAPSKQKRKRTRIRAP